MYIHILCTCNVLRMYRAYTYSKLYSLVLVHSTLIYHIECVDVVHVHMASFLLLYSPLPALSLAALSFLLYCLSLTVPKSSSS